MIRNITLKDFKRFWECEFDFTDSVVLVDLSNAWNSILLQGILPWKFGFDRWIAQRKGSITSRRSGIPITHYDFIPVASKDLLIPFLNYLDASELKHKLYLLASVMNREEIHPEIYDKLYQIAELPGPI